MISKRLTLAAATGLTAALALTGCGGGSNSDNAQNAAADRQAPRAVSDGVSQDGGAADVDGYGADAGAGDYGSSGDAGQAAVGFTATAVKAKQTATMGKIVVDQKNWTLYVFDKDSVNPPKSKCDDDCAKLWPPILVKETPQLQGIEEDKVGTVVRSDGQVQLTIAGRPVYRYAKDGKAGVWTGHGVKGVWWAIQPDGKKAVKCLPGMANAGNAALKAKKTRTVGTIVVDGRGRTLYRFDKDTINPSKSKCNGDCLKKWPAFMWPGKKPRLQGINPDLVGKVQRSDGSWQVTLGGWPLYYYFEDKKAGDWKGIGVGGVWWAVQPNGKRAQKCMPGMTPEQSNEVLNRGKDAGSGGYGNENSGDSAGGGY